MKKTLLLLLLSTMLVQAQEKGESKLPKPDQIGPAKVALGTLASLDLPKGYAFYNKEHTQKLMEQLGNHNDGNELGLIRAANDKDVTYLVLIGYEDSGHVKDDEKIDADKLLQSMKEGTEAGNEERKQKGIGALHVTGWLEPPRYEAATHRVVWAPQGKSEESDGTTSDIVNYNTRLLGRTGVLYENLMTSLDALPKAKPESDKLLAATTFKDGQKYKNYQSGDKTAEYGLMGLILGGGLILAKKAGMLGLLLLGLKKFGLVLLAFKKFAIFIIAGLGAGVRKLFGMFTGRGRSTESAHQVMAPPPEMPEHPPSGE